MCYYIDCKMILSCKELKIINFLGSPIEEKLSRKGQNAKSFFNLDKDIKDKGSYSLLCDFDVK